jgi:hypothetical protein
MLRYHVLSMLVAVLFSFLMVAALDIFIRNQLDFLPRQFGVCVSPNGVPGYLPESAPEGERTYEEIAPVGERIHLRWTR